MTTTTTERELTTGCMIGEYQVVRFLDEGGMGSVYEGVHPVIGKRVAIKVVKPEIATMRESVDRFIFEASAVNRISHPSIIDVFAFGKLEDGRPYFVMEFLEGESLQQRLTRDGTLTPDVALPILREAADALDAAHAVDIVHRDLKPHNIFLTRERGRSGVRVVDFGIAKFSAGNMGMTQTGMLLGTPLYMSPEQCRGLAVDHRTDIYAFGVLCYRTLVGRHPFEAESIATLVFKHVNDPPTLPSNFGAPRAIDAILTRALAKNPADRHPNLTSLVQELTRALTGTPAQMAATVIVHVAQGAGDATRALAPSANLELTLLEPDTVALRAAATAAAVPASATVAPTATADAVDVDTATWLRDGGTRTVEGHTRPVHAVAFAPNGRLFATASADRTARLWDRGGRPLRTLTGHLCEITCIAISADSRLVAAAGLDGVVRLWDVKTGAAVSMLQGHEGDVQDLAFAGTGQLVSAGRDKTVRVWDPATGEGRILRGHRGAVRALAVSAGDRPTIASAGADASVRLWSDASGRREVLEGLEGTIYAVTFSANGRQVYGSDSKGTIAEWDVERALERGVRQGRFLRGHRGAVCHLAHSPDGSLLASAGADGDIRLWGGDGGGKVVLSGHASKVCHVAFVAHGRLLVSSSTDSTVRLWDVATRRPGRIINLDGPAKGTAISPDSRLLVSCSAASSVVRLTAISETEHETASRPRVAAATPRATAPAANPPLPAAGVRRIMKILGLGEQ